MQKIIVKNRQDAIDMTMTDFSLFRVIISITSHGDEFPEFNLSNNAIRDILFLQFNDEEVGETVMNNEDALKIADFVLKYYNEVDQIVVHCDAGVSRSAGVAAALYKFFTGSDDIIFDNFNYYPNIVCYRKTLNALMDKYGDDKYE